MPNEFVINMVCCKKKHYLTSIPYINVSHVAHDILYAYLTHWGRVTLICVSKLTIIDLDNGLTPWLCHGIIRTNAGILLIEPLGTKFSEISIGIHPFSFKKSAFENAICKMTSILFRPQCMLVTYMPGLRVYCQFICYQICSCMRRFNLYIWLSSNLLYLWVINNVIAYKGSPYIRGLMILY